MGYGLLIAGIAGLDLWLKGLIEKKNPEEFPKPLKRSGGRILLYRNHNAGFPFGFLQKHAGLVRGVPLIIISGLGGVLCYLLTKPGQIGKKLSLSFLIGGGLSNLYDRLFKGYVVDYFSFQLGWLKKVVFNLGDLFVFLGTILLAMMDALSSLNKKFS